MSSSNRLISLLCILLLTIQAPRVSGTSCSSAVETYENSINFYIFDSYSSPYSNYMGINIDGDSSGNTYFVSTDTSSMTYVWGRVSDNTTKFAKNINAEAARGGTSLSSDDTKLFVTVDTGDDNKMGVCTLSATDGSLQSVIKIDTQIQHYTWGPMMSWADDVLYFFSYYPGNSANHALCKTNLQETTTVNCYKPDSGNMYIVSPLGIDSNIVLSTGLYTDASNNERTAINKYDFSSNTMLWTMSFGKSPRPNFRSHCLNDDNTELFSFFSSSTDGYHLLLSNSVADGSENWKVKLSFDNTYIVSGSSTIDRIHYRGNEIWIHAVQSQNYFVRYNTEDKTIQTHNAVSRPHGSNKVASSYLNPNNNLLYLLGKNENNHGTVYIVVDPSEMEFSYPIYQDENPEYPVTVTDFTSETEKFTDNGVTWSSATENVIAGTFTVTDDSVTLDPNSKNENFKIETCPSSDDEEITHTSEASSTSNSFYTGLPEYDSTTSPAVTRTLALEASTDPVPSWVNLDTTTGEITYNAPSSVGTHTFKIKATYSSSYEVTKEITITITASTSSSGSGSESDDDDDHCFSSDTSGGCAGIVIAIIVGVCIIVGAVVYLVYYTYKLRAKKLSMKTKTAPSPQTSNVPNIPQEHDMTQENMTRSNPLPKVD